MRKTKKEQWKNATEIPPSQQHKIKASENPKSEDILLKEHDAVMIILKYLNTEPQEYNGQRDPSKYYSLKKVLSKLSHIKNIKSLIRLLIAARYIQKSTVEDEIRISIKGIQQIINNDHLG
jgi:hypothetical protein